MELTAKQKLFVDHYLSNGFNATQAALSAGYSENTAYSMGAENLKKPQIKSYIEQSQQLTSQALQIKKEDLLRDLLDIKELNKTNPKTSHNAIKAIEVINKMQGFNEPDKVENKLVGFDIRDLLTFDDE